VSDRRASTIARATKETRIEGRLDLGGGEVRVRTGLGFRDHMLSALATHGRLGLELSVEGDLEVDDHHTIEDAALAIGAALDDALGDRRGVRRFAHAYAPLDEALARCVIDLSGRGGAWVDTRLVRERLGDVSCENLPHFFASLAVAGRLTLHVDVLKGSNDHHKAEAAFKAFALALREAVRVEGSEVPSTKGSL